MNSKIHARICELITKSEYVCSQQKKNITLDYLLSIVSAEFEVSESWVKSPSRKGNICLARHVFCFIARVKFDFSLYSIAKFVNRNHSSIIYFIDTGKNRIWTKDEKWMLWYNRCMSVINKELN